MNFEYRTLKFLLSLFNILYSMFDIFYKLIP